jgi:hypothetical protein
MHDTLFLGRIEVRPALNESERDYLADLAQSSSTLRGTPTGRGDASVPFAHLAWEPCESGCCLTSGGPLDAGAHLSAADARQRDRALPAPVVMQDSPVGTRRDEAPLWGVATVESPVRSTMRMST